MKTGEIYTRALTNPKDEFKSIGQQYSDHVAHFNAVGKLVDKEGELVFPTYDMDWELVHQPYVDFMTAINSGKETKPNGTSYDFMGFSYWLNNRVLSLEIINGKWLIK